jgi:hypothetical protein
VTAWCGGSAPATSSDFCSYFGLFNYILKNELSQKFSFFKIRPFSVVPVHLARLMKQSRYMHWCDY